MLETVEGSKMALTFSETIEGIGDLCKDSAILLMPFSLILALIYYFFMQANIADVRTKFINILKITYIGTFLVVTNSLFYFLMLFRGAFNSESWGPLMVIFFFVMFALPLIVIVGHLLVGLFGAKYFLENSKIEKNDIKWLASFSVFISLFAFGSFLILYWYVGLAFFRET